MAKATEKASRAYKSVMAPAFLATKLSAAWVSTSKPVSAMRPGGRAVSKSLSRIAMSGRIRLSTRGCFTWSWVRMAKSVTSEPEPEVVGMAASRQSPLAK